MLAAGTLALGQVASNTISALGTGQITLGNGGTLQSNVTGSLGNTIVVSNGAAASIGAASGNTLTLAGILNPGNAGTTLTFGSDTLTGTVDLLLANGTPTSFGAAIVVAGGTVRTRNALGSLLIEATGGLTVGTRTTAATLDLFGDSAAIAGLTGSAAGVITNSGNTLVNLIVTQASDSTFAGVIRNGPNALNLTKLGAVTLTLTVANTYSGTTTISGGTMQIGNGGTTGSIPGAAILNNATLAFNRSDDITYGGVISGGGRLVKLGGGTLTLTGANTYSGTTTVSAGMLQVGDGTSAATISNALATIGLGATLRFQSTANQSINGGLAGAGSLVKAGSGTLILFGNATEFTGATRITEGTIRMTAGDRLGSGMISLQGGALATATTTTISNNVAFRDATGNQLQPAAGTTLTLIGQLDVLGTMRVSGGVGSTVRLSNTTAVLSRSRASRSRACSSTSSPLPRGSRRG